MQTGANYEIARSSGSCSATGEPLEPGAPCVACLCEREADAGFDRLDYSIDAWNAGARPQRLFSYWKTTVAEANRKRRVFVDDDLLMNLFERLEGDGRPQRVAFRFVIALVLMRKRHLKHVGKRMEGKDELWLLQPRTAGGVEPPPPFEVVNPHLSDDDVQSVSDQLGEILNGDLE